MTTTEKLDIVFNIIKEGKIKDLDVISKSTGIDYVECMQLIRMIKKEKLVMEDFFTLSLLGKEFEGFLNREKRILSEEKFTYEKLKLEIDVLKNQIETNNDTIINNRLNRIMAFVAIVISIVSVIIALLKK